MKKRKRRFYVVLLYKKNKKRTFVKEHSARNMLVILLLLGGDIEQCPGPTDISDIYTTKGFRMVHQNMRGLFRNMEKVTEFLHT